MPSVDCVSSIERAHSSHIGVAIVYGGTSDTKDSMKHWLVVYGSASDQIRSAVGNSPSEAMKDAFGLVASNMSVIQLTLYELRTVKHRGAKIVELLTRHRTHFLPGGRCYREDSAEYNKLVVDAIDKTLSELRKYNGTKA